MYPLGMPPHYKAPDALQGLFGRYLHWSTYFGHKISKIRCQKIK